MAVLNPDGSVYQVAGSIQQFNPSAPELCLFDMWDQQAILQGGSPIFYYEVLIQSGSIDPLYLEDRGKIFNNNPIQLYGYYEPITSQNFQDVFGIGGPDDIVFEFNYTAVLKAIGHPPKVGSRIYTPQRREDWVVIQRNVAEFKMWGILRLQLVCTRFQESVTTGEGKVTTKKPDFRIE